MWSAKLLKMCLCKQGQGSENHQRHWLKQSKWAFFFIVQHLGRKSSSSCACCSQVKAQCENIWGSQMCCPPYHINKTPKLFFQTDSIKAKQNKAYVLLLPDWVRVWSAWTHPGSEAVSSVSSEPLTWSMDHSAPIRLDWPHWTQTWLK